MLYRLVWLCLLPLIAVPAWGNDWGELPPGYTWYENEAMRVAIPVPDGWHVKVEAHDGTQALFVSKEDIAAEGQFQTGFTLNYFEQFSKRESAGPTRFAAAFVLQIQKTKEVVQEPWVEKLEQGITGIGIRWRDPRNSPALVHYYLISDDAEDSLRLSIFEAPEAQWEQAWKHGAVMLDRAQFWK